MKRRGIALLLALCLALSGCMGRQLEEELLVIVLAVDETEEGHTRLTIKVPRNGSAGGASKEGEGGDQGGYLLLDATGRGFSEAMALLHATTPRNLNFSQVREVVIGEKAARSADFANLLLRIDELPRMRGAAAVIICKGEGNAFAKAQKPYVGTRLSRYAETTLANYAGKGFTPNTSLSEGIRDLAFGFRDPLFVYGGVNDFRSPQTPEKGALNGAPGSLSRQNGDGIELFGAAATDGVCVNGFLTGYEVALLHLINGSVHSLDIQLEEDIPLMIYARTPATLSVRLDRRPAVLEISLLCEVHHPPGFPPDEEKLARKITADLKGALTHLQSLRCDGLGFGNIAVRQFGTVADWERLGWRDVYARAQTEITLFLQYREN